ncbi:flagellar basal body P-ring protein FlgI, partial [Escherichia coli]|uniref:flagellar basal body P-ring protein FlgI n=1 Tax=Escherichia coli TaxID=562 RepID=UPI001484FE90
PPPPPLSSCASTTAVRTLTSADAVPRRNVTAVPTLAVIEIILGSSTPQDATLCIHSRTGSVLMNREVTLDSCAVAQGNRSVTVNRQANVSQPDTPFGGGQT